MMENAETILRTFADCDEVREILGDIAWLVNPSADDGLELDAIVGAGQKDGVPTVICTLPGENGLVAELRLYFVAKPAGDA